MPIERQRLVEHHRQRAPAHPVEFLQEHCGRYFTGDEIRERCPAPDLLITTVLYAVRLDPDWDERDVVVECWREPDGQMYYGVPEEGSS